MSVPLYTARQLILKADEKYQMLAQDLNQHKKSINQLSKQIGSLKKQSRDVPEYLYEQIYTLKKLTKDCEIQLDAREDNICSYIDQLDYFLNFQKQSKDQLYMNVKSHNYAQWSQLSI